jgi:hypothetical protein
MAFRFLEQTKSRKKTPQKAKYKNVIRALRGFIPYEKE